MQPEQLKTESKNTPYNNKASKSRCPNKEKTGHHDVDVLYKNKNLQANMM